MNTQNKEEALARFRRAKERKRLSVEKTKQLLAVEYLKMFPNSKSLHFEQA
ncbi:MAG: hypothetical protein MJZ69_03915 [Bacteroidaceae bacterium]|nr:hypothetical protein [Candidatus Minthousia equi]MCQ2245919.1 hypothetical protein [Bacteroidaceae bacterium]